MPLPLWVRAAIARVRNMIRGTPTDEAAIAATAQQFGAVDPPVQAQIAQAASQQAQLVALANQSPDDAPLVQLGPDDVLIDPIDYVNVSVRFEGPGGAVRWRNFQVSYLPGMTIGDARQLAEALADLAEEDYPGWAPTRSVFM